MIKQGTIVLVEDDTDDKLFFENTLKSLGIKNEVKSFDNTEAAFEFLCTTKKTIFIIFSDINLPGRNGLEFKFKIDNDKKLRKKSIPFVFYTTTAHQQDVNDAYTNMTVQGFFKKDADPKESSHTLKTIFEYWNLCKHPNTN